MWWVYKKKKLKKCCDLTYLAKQFSGKRATRCRWFEDIQYLTATQVCSDISEKTMLSILLLIHCSDILIWWTCVAVNRLQFTLTL